VKNNSKEFVHEMLVVRVVDRSHPLPYDAAAGQVDEATAGSLGEVSELEPGKSGSVTLQLTPGQYLLFCNLPGHYMAGMWTLVDVQ
jgi:uncharacterized cupredoxin-like copper-binding protein